MSSGVNLVLKTGGRGSGFKIWRGSWVLKVQQKEAQSTWLSISTPECVFNIHKSFYYSKVTTFESAFISHPWSLYIGYRIIIFHGDTKTPRSSIPKPGGSRPKLPGLTPMCMREYSQIINSEMGFRCREGFVLNFVIFFYSIRLLHTSNDSFRGFEPEKNLPIYIILYIYI